MTDHPRATILIVDNDEDLLRALTRRLERWGYRCLSACTGAQALSLFREVEVDLIITDLNMPQMDGIEFVRRLRRTCDVPVIVITGFRRTFAAELEELGAVTVLRKPFASDSLIDLITTELIPGRTRKAG